MRRRWPGSVGWPRRCSRPFATAVRRPRGSCGTPVARRVGSGPHAARQSRTGAVKSVGGRFPMCSPETLPKRVRDTLPADLLVALAPLLTMIETACREVRTYDRRVTALVAERYPEAAHLQQVPGVGPLTALCYVLTLEDPTRFRHSRSVGAYLGLLSTNTEPVSARTPDHEGRRFDAPPAVGLRGPVHAGPILPPRATCGGGVEFGRSWSEECEEARGGGRGPEARGALASTLDHRRGVRAVSRCTSAGSQLICRTVVAK